MGMEAKSEIKTTQNLNFLDCIDDKLFTSQEVKEFFEQNMKVDGKRGNFTDKVEIKADTHSLKIVSSVKICPRYLGFLSKKFVFKKKLHDWIRVVSDGKNGREFTYYKVEKQGEE